MSENRPHAGPVELWAVKQFHSGASDEEIGKALTKRRSELFREHGFDGVIAQPDVLRRMAADPERAQNLVSTIRDHEMAGFAIRALSDGRVDYWNKPFYKALVAHEPDQRLSAQIEQQIVHAGCQVNANARGPEQGFRIRIGQS